MVLDLQLKDDKKEIYQNKDELYTNIRHSEIE